MAANVNVPPEEDTLERNRELMTALIREFEKLRPLVPAELRDDVSEVLQHYEKLRDARDERTIHRLVLQESGDFGASLDEIHRHAAAECGEGFLPGRT